MDETEQDTGLRRIVMIVALMNLAYFGLEFAVALTIGSVSLFADSVDFLEDASVNLLIVFALGWTAQNRARAGMALAAILLIPGVATLWAIWEHFGSSMPPHPQLLSLTGLGALAINLFCAFLLARFRQQSGSLTKAAFLSARNDALANLGIIAAGLVSASLWPSPLPDLLVGIAIAIMNADAARAVLSAAQAEIRIAAKP